jgi:Tol biopolymer transport system component
MTTASLWSLRNCKATKRFFYIRLVSMKNVMKREQAYHSLVTGETRRITNNEYREINPVFSNDDASIVYQSFENGQPDIFSIRRDGGNKKLIVGGSGYEWKPTFSHDGQRIFYTSIRDGKEDIYVNNIDGGNEINLTNSPLSEGYPAISKSGDFIVYSAAESIVDVGDFDRGLFKLDLFSLNKIQIVPGSNGVTRFSDPKLSIDLGL